MLWRTAKHQQKIFEHVYVVLFGNDIKVTQMTDCKFSYVLLI